MNSAGFAAMLARVGASVQKIDIPRCYHFFDLQQSGVISTHEYAATLTLTDHELDLVIDNMKAKVAEALKQLSKLKHSKTLGEMFHHINTREDGILSLADLLNMLSKFEIFVTVEEGRRVHQLMDLDNDDRVEEKDFVSFMKKPSETVARKAYRLQKEAERFRATLLRGSTTLKLPVGQSSEHFGYACVCILLDIVEIYYYFYYYLKMFKNMFLLIYDFINHPSKYI